MALNSIITNISAYTAQLNIGMAGDKVNNSVARLSSGSRIVKASDDVAGLAAGTSLDTGVRGLRAGLQNATLGVSLLQVADGAGAQITSMLQRMKAIAQQAGSGTLTATDRQYLDVEFQKLSATINATTNSTTFNGVKLLDGSVSGKKALVTNTAINTTNSATSRDSTGSILTFANAVPASGDTVTIAGVTITFTSSEVGTSTAAGKVVIGADITDTAANLVAFLNQSGNPNFANLRFTSSAATVSVSYTGGTLVGTTSVTVTASPTTAANLTAANATILLQSDADGLGINRVSYSGAIAGDFFARGGTAATDAGMALDLANLRYNADFIGKFGEGKIGQFTATFTVASTVVLSLKVGDITYTTTATDITSGTSDVVPLTFTGRDGNGVAAGGTFAANLNPTAIGTITSQADADTVAGQLNNALRGVTFYQNRDIKSFTNGEVVSVGGVQVANLTNASVDIRTSSFASVNISKVKITAPGVGETDARIEFTVNGQVFRSLSGIGNQIGKVSRIALQNVDDPTQYIAFVTGDTGITGATSTTLDLGTQAKADAIAEALQTAFGLGDATASLEFQVGNGADDKLGVSIDSLTTADLGLTGLNVLTQESASAASDALSLAIGLATAARANIGALQSQFGFASATIQVSLQNQDAARGVLLDTDVAAESTSYATAQVQLQAGISVLAQANQLSQNLLKLIS